VGELVPAACVGNETSKVVTIGAGGCYVSTAYGKSGKGRQPDVFADGVCIMVSSTMPMALYHFLIMTLSHCALIRPPLVRAHWHPSWSHLRA
jgi:hypothetical protein